MAQIVKNLPAMWETWIQSLGLEDLLEREWLPTPVFLPGEYHGQRGAWGWRSPWGCKELDKTGQLNTFTFKLFHCYYTCEGDLWCDYCNCFEAMNHVHIRSEFNGWMLCVCVCVCVCVLTVPLASHCPFLSLSLDLSVPWDTTVFKLGQFITL